MNNDFETIKESYSKAGRKSFFAIKDKKETKISDNETTRYTGRAEKN